MSFSAGDKYNVACLTMMPKFLPEITIGAHEFDEKYYAYKSVSSHDALLQRLVEVCPLMEKLTVSGLYDGLILTKR